MQNNRWWHFAAIVFLSPLVALANDGDQRERKETFPMPGNKTVEFTMIKLPAGKITLKDADGREKEHDVKSVWMGKFEVQWQEYDVYYQALDVAEAARAKLLADEKHKSRPSQPYEPPQRNWGHEGSPAGSMFAREAHNYCKWLGQRTGKKYRLPTEAEWEYACRAGASAPYAPKSAELKKVAWFALNSDAQTHPSGEKAPNAWGFYDMLGNVAEWVTLADGTDAVAGGSFEDDADDVHSAARKPFDPAWQRGDPNEPKGKSWLSNGGHIGFRLVRED